MAMRMRKFVMGLVETSVRTESGKRAARAAFKWVIRSILRGWGQGKAFVRAILTSQIFDLTMSGLGTQRVAGQRWRNPASPDVLRALPWEFGDGDVFISSAPSPILGPLESSQSALRYLDSTWADRRSSSLASGSGEVQTGSRPGAVTSVSISAGMTRSASSPGTPVLPPESPIEAPAYLIAKPSTLPAVFVRDSPEYLRSQAEIAATLGSSETMKRSSRVSSVISSLPHIIQH